jgi:hypothetical protein
LVAWLLLERAGTIGGIDGCSAAASRSTCLLTVTHIFRARLASVSRAASLRRVALAAAAGVLTGL